MQNTVSFEPVAFSPNPDLTDPNLATPFFQPTETRIPAPWMRTLARKWDMIAVIMLILASAAYGVYALLFLTGY